MDGATASAICDAIRRLCLLEFDYDGLHRVVAPYVHGLGKKDGREAVRAIQVDGGSRSGGFGFGKLWLVERMRNLRASERPFVADDPHYNPDDSMMREIHCRVAPARKRR